MKKIQKSAVALLLVLTIFTGIGTGAFAASTPKEKTHAQLAREAASQGMVLLENKDSALPIPHGQTVALFGSGQINFVKGGTGSGDVNVDYVVNLLQGMQGKEEEGEISLYPPLVEAYSDYIAGGGKGELRLTDEQIQAAAESAETAVVTISRVSGEGSDRKAAKGDYYLSDDETALLNQVNSAGFEKVAVVLNIGGVIDTSWIKDYPDISVLVAWQPGMEGGNAVADVLCGDVNPSGKLTDTFAKSYDDYPSAQNFSQHSSYVNYEEDIFVGYRFFETFDSNYEKVNYEFGYGLSYTTFDISDVEVAPEGDDINITARVTNTGDTAGREVVQAYFSAPQGELGKPWKELAAFAKTRVLDSGESQIVHMSYAINDMASYDDTGKIEKSAYVLEPGDYEIYVGNSVRNAGEEGARYTYTVDSLDVVEQLTAQMTPSRLRKRLLADGSYEYLESDSIQIPVITATGGTKVESENFVEAADGVTTENFNNGSATGTCVAYMNTKGNYVSYDLDVKESGNYQLVFHASNGRADINNMLNLYVDGVLQDGVNVFLPRTGDGDGKGEWYNFADCAAVTITLPEGKCTLKIVSNGICGNLDYMTFTKIDETIQEEQGSSEATEAQNIGKTLNESDVTDKTISLSDVYYNPDLMDSFIAQLSNQQLADLSQGKRAKIAGGTGGIGGLPEYGVPSAQTSDGPAGIRLTVHSTAWPCSTLQACTWDTELIRQIGVAVGEEAKKNDVDIWLAPGMNIHRDPLCGRNFEYYSEDPLVTGKIAAALTDGVQSQGIGVTLKHFACNNKENNRSSSDSRVSERALREIYLKGFEIAVREASPWCIMSSYNLINGTEAAENYDLLTNVLRGEWGFEGMVMTDWGNNSISSLEVKAGNDVKMPSGNSSNILSALESGSLTRAELERNMKSILNMVMKTNVFQTQVLGSEEDAIKIGATSPTKIKAVDYYLSSNAIGAEACTDTDGGTNPTYTAAGEWLAYRIQVQRGGSYNLYPRIAGQTNNCGFDIYVDDNWVGSFNQPTATGGWQNWVTAAPVAIRLSQGNHSLKLLFTGSSLNINWFQIMPLSLSTENIAQVTDPEGIQVVCGTELENIDSLPRTVTATLANGMDTSLEVVWKDTGSRYNPKIAGTYNLTGNLILPTDGSITNNNGLTAKIAVKVLPQNGSEILRAKLTATIATSEGYQQSKYTSGSWESLQTALQAARAIATDETAVKEQLQTALDHLTDAISRLSLKSSGGSHSHSGAGSGSTITPSAPPSPTASFKLDTTSTYTFGVGGKYYFLVKTASATVPTVTSSSASVVAAFSRKVDRGYLFEITGISSGTAVITARIGEEAASFPVVVTGAAAVRSDTTLPFTIKTGGKYCFKISVTNGNTLIPGFTTGNSAVFKTRMIKKVGNDYYFEIQAVGKPGNSAGIYTTISDQAAVRHCVVSIA